MRPDRRNNFKSTALASIAFNINPFIRSHHGPESVQGTLGTEGYFFIQFILDHNNDFLTQSGLKVPLSTPRTPQ